MLAGKKQCASRQPLRCPVGLRVQYVHIWKCATYAIGCVYAAMEQRTMRHNLSVRDLRMRLHCQGVTCECVDDLARDVRMHPRCYGTTCGCVYATCYAASVRRAIYRCNHGYKERR